MATDPRHPEDGSAGYLDASTRYLCAGAHLDPAFARDVVRLILRQPRRAVGPANGVDTALVIRHCIAAYRRLLLRDGALVAVLALLAAAYVTHRDAAVAAAVVAAWAVVVLERAVVRFDVLATRIGRRRSPAPLPTSARLRARLDEIEALQSDNLVVYSAYDPFVGSGTQVGAWSFVVDLRKGKEVLGDRRAPEPVDLAVIRRRVTEAVRATGIEGLAVDDVLHVGYEAVPALALLATRFGRPNGHIDAGQIEQSVDQPTDTRRHFQRLRVTAWGGELVLTVFLRFMVINGRLCAEATYTMLSPVDHGWHVVDRIEPAPMPLEILRLIRSSVLATPGAVLGAAPRLVAEAWRTWISEPLRRWEEDVAAREGGVLDCGTLTTVRQRGASAAYWRYFQRLDQERFVKVLERSVLDSLIAVLDEYGVDTSELVERQTTILNQGVMMTGGTLQAQSLAVGRRARIVNKTRRLAARTRAA